MNYIQLLFSYFNAPLFATFIIAMYWTGLGMLILGLLFLFWARSRPLHPEQKKPETGDTTPE